MRELALAVRCFRRRAQCVSALVVCAILLAIPASAAPNLVAISVTPQGPQIQVGSSQQFAATGTYSDNSTQDLTSQVTWLSTDTSIATITSGGLLNAVAQGSALVRANLGNIINSTSVTVIPVDTRTPTTTTLQSFNNPISYGQSVTFQASVTPGAGVTTGDYVSFYDGVAYLGGAPLDATGKTTFQPTPAGAGSRSITAFFNGDATYQPSTSAAVVETVNPAPVGFSFFSCSPNPVITGQQLQCHIQNVLVPVQELFQVRDGGATIATVPDTGVDTYFSTSYLAVGTHTLTVYYPGDANLLSATSAPFSQSVIQLETILLTPANYSLPNGQVQQFTATGVYSDTSVADLTSTANWSSSNPSVASVNAGGFASSIAPGFATITVALGSVSAATNLTVTPAPTNYAAGSQPYIVANADFNRDGKLDLLEYDQGGNVFIVRLGNGDGSFTSLPSFSPGTPNTPINPVFVGDFNNDGIPDLLVSTGGNEFLRIGNGDGTFQAAVDLGVGGAGSAVVADINNDGNLDILLPNGPVLLGKGDGTFTSAPNIGYGGALGVGDLNGDGFADVVQGSNFNGQSCGSLRVEVGNGDGTFQTPAQYPYQIGCGPTSVIDITHDGKADVLVPSQGGVDFFAGNGNGTVQAPISSNLALFYGVQLLDFNQDGKLDYLTASPTVNTIEVYLGNGDGTFQSSSLNFGTGSGPYSVVAGDFNRDGVTDLIAANLNGNNLSFIPGKSRTTSLTFRQTLSYDTGTNAVGLGVGDVNRDGKPDFLVANAGSNDVRLVKGTSAGIFVPAASSTPAGTAPQTIAVGDFNRDGTLDFITADKTGSTLTVMLGDGAGNFSAASGSPITLAAAPTFVAAADLFHHGILDLAVANGNNVTVYKGAGDGSFTLSATYAAGTNPVYIAVADVNRDGQLDLIVANNNASGTVNVLLNQKAPSQGLFLAAAPYPAGSNPIAITIGDFNRDGKPDIAVADAVAATNNVSILLGNGDGTFQALKSASVAGVPAGIATADFDGDGKPDLAVSNGNEITFLLGNADANVTFQTPVSFPGGTNPTQLVVADFNFDGKPDVAAANNTASGTVSVLLNNSSSSQSGKGTVGSQNNPNSLAAADFNEDGKSDLAIVNYGSNTVTVQYGNGDGTFGSAQNLPVGNNPDAVAAGDLNGDKHIDLAVANYTDGTVSILMGDGKGNFAAPTSCLAPIPVSPNPTSIIMEDLNGDGKLDLAIAYSQTNTATILFGQGNGCFQTPVNYSTREIITNSATRRLQSAPSVPTVGPRMIATGNFGGHSYADLAVVRPFSNNVSVLFNDGKGGYTTTSIPVGSIPLGVAAADFRGKGVSDIAVINAGGNSVNILLNNGSGGFTASPDIATGSTPIAIAGLDFNGDGKPDLGWVNSGDNSVTLIPGKGDGSFDQNAAATYAAGTQPYDMVIGSFTGGGLIDLAVANHTSNNVSVILNLGGNSIVTSSSANPSPYNGFVVFTTTVAATVNGAGTPKGSVTYLDGNTPLQTVPLNSSGQATFSTSSLSVGSHAIHVVYSGDGFFIPNTAVYSQLVQLAPTTTTLSSSANPGIFSQNVTFTVTVTSSSGAPNGTVTFADNGVQLGQPVALTGGQAIFSTSSLSVATHSITATYSGSAIFAGSSSSALPQVVNQTGTTTAVVSSANPSGYGLPVTFTAIVTSAASGKPTGSVTFKDGPAILGTATLNAAGQASFPAPALSVGSPHSITGVYGGDTSFAGSTSAPFIQIVNKGATNISVAGAPNPASQGSPVVFTAALSPFVGTTGEILTFMDGSTTLGTGTLDGNGQATYSKSDLSLNLHYITAVYGGDANLSGNTSSSFPELIVPASSTALVSSKNPSIFGDAVTFTASVTGGNAPLTSGTVTFYNGNSAISGAIAVDSNGKAVYPTSALSASTLPYTITAQYSGGSGYGPSVSAPVYQKIDALPTLLLSLSHAPALARTGKTVAFSAVITNNGTAISNLVFTLALSGTVASINSNNVGAFCSGTAPVTCLIPSLAQGTQLTITVSAVPLITHSVQATATTNANTIVVTDTVQVRLRPLHLP